MKIIKLTESDLEQIVKKVLSEQNPMSTAVKTNQTVATSTGPKLQKKFQCLDEEKVSCGTIRNLPRSQSVFC